MFFLLKFSNAFENALIHASKSVIINRPGRLSKRACDDNSESSQSKCASVPTPCFGYSLWSNRAMTQTSEQERSLSSVTSIFKNKMFIITAWKVSKHGVFSGPYFLAFGLNTKRYGVSLRIQSECEKIRTRKNSVFGHFSRSGKLSLCLLKDRKCFKDYLYWYFICDRSNTKH